MGCQCGGWYHEVKRYRINALCVCAECECCGCGRKWCEYLYCKVT